MTDLSKFDAAIEEAQGNIRYLFEQHQNDIAGMTARIEEMRKKYKLLADKAADVLEKAVEAKRVRQISGMESGEIIDDRPERTIL